MYNHLDLDPNSPQVKAERALGSMALDPGLSRAISILYNPYYGKPLPSESRSPFFTSDLDFIERLAQGDIQASRAKLEEILQKPNPYNDTLTYLLAHHYDRPLEAERVLSAFDEFTGRLMRWPEQMQRVVLRQSLVKSLLAHHTTQLEYGAQQWGGFHINPFIAMSSNPNIHKARVTGLTERAKSAGVWYTDNPADSREFEHNKKRGQHICNLLYNKFFKEPKNIFQKIRFAPPVSMPLAVIMENSGTSGSFGSLTSQALSLISGSPLDAYQMRMSRFSGGILPASSIIVNTRNRDNSERSDPQLLQVSMEEACQIALYPWVTGCLPSALGFSFEERFVGDILQQVDLRERIPESDHTKPPVGDAERADVDAVIQDIWDRWGTGRYESILRPVVSVLSEYRLHNADKFPEFNEIVRYYAEKS